MTSKGVSVELRRAAVSGARWTALARLGAEALALASSVVLARLVAPAEFGEAAVALTVVGLSAVLGTAGCTALVVQRPELSAPIFAGVRVVTLTTAAVLTVLTIAVAQLVVRATLGEDTAHLLLIASPAWLLVAVGAPSQAKLHRDFRFRALAIVETAAALLGAGIAVAAAIAGAGSEAVVLGGVALVGTMGLLSLAAEPPRVWRTDRASVREAISFGAPVTASSLVYLTYRNVDYVILAARSTSAQVGFYWRAFQLGVGYQSKVSRVMQRVSFPLYSRTRGLDELRQIRSSVVRTHATVLLPLLAAFVGMAPDFIPFVFGDDWEPAVLPAQILAVAGMADAVTTDVGPLTVALGRPGALVRWNLVQLVGYVILVASLAPFGITAVAIGVACFGVLSVIGIHAFIHRPYLGLRIRDLAIDIVPGLTAGAVVLAATSGVRYGLSFVDAHRAVSLAAAALASAALWMLVLQRFFPDVWRDLLSVLTRVVRRGGAGTGPPTEDVAAPAGGGSGSSA